MSAESIQNMTAILSGRSPSGILTGRTPLISDLTSIDGVSGMVSELNRILPYFVTNREEIVRLQRYHAGRHGILERIKTVRTDIDNKIIVNYAYSATRDIVGYYLGKPIQYVHRAGRESIEPVAEFNRILDAENKNLVNVKVANDQSICGVGYLGVFKDVNKRNGTSLSLKRCDPACSFVVYSSHPEVDELYCVSYVTEQQKTDMSEARTIYTIWTANKRYTIIGKPPNRFSSDTVESTSVSDFSYGGYLPIQEYPNNMFYMGDWEPAIPLMDAIDNNASDRSNDIQQTVHAILVALGVEIDDEQWERLRDNGLLNIPGVNESVSTPYINYIGSPLDGGVGETFSEYLESCMNVVVGLPDRKTRSGGGGDTGTAVELRDGWMDIDLVASFKESFFIESDRNTLGAILYLLKTNSDFPYELEVQDIEIKFSRNKTANVQSKAQALSTLLQAGIHPQDAIEWCDVTTDIQSVVTRIREYKEESMQNALRSQELLSAQSDSKQEDNDSVTAQKDDKVKDKDETDT